MVLKGTAIWLNFGTIYNAMVLKEVAMYKICDNFGING